TFLVESREEQLLLKVSAEFGSCSTLLNLMNVAVKTPQATPKVDNDYLGKAKLPSRLRSSDEVRTVGKCGHKTCTKSGKCPTGRKIIGKDVEILGTFPTRNRRASGPGSLAQSWMPTGERQAGSAAPVSSQANMWPYQSSQANMWPKADCAIVPHLEELQGSSRAAEVSEHQPWGQQDLWINPGLQWGSRGLKCHPIVFSKFGGNIQFALV
ncbi:hypothetical protein HGM15179_007486, partial [Zosterops borbonicus]